MKTSKKAIAGSLLTTILVIFMLSWITLLSSCVATVRTPRHVRSTVVIEGQVGGEHHDRDDRQARRAHRKELREHHD